MACYHPTVCVFTAVPIATPDVPYTRVQRGLRSESVSPLHASSTAWGAVQGIDRCGHAPAREEPQEFVQAVRACLATS